MSMTVTLLVFVSVFAIIAIAGFKALNKAEQKTRAAKRAADIKAKNAPRYTGPLYTSHGREIG